MNVAVQIEYPHLARFERNDAPLPRPGIPSVRRLANGDPSNPFAIDDIIALADGVPRSLSFHAVNVHFGHAEFGQAAAFPGGLTVRAILTGLGKPSRTAQFVTTGATSSAPTTTADSPTPRVPAESALINPIILKYQRGMRALIERIDLPYDLPPAIEALQTNLGGSGPLKPTLV